MKDAPTAVFKYLSASRAQEVFAKLLIRFSQVSVLNDAREMRPPLSGLAPRPRLEQLLGEKSSPRFLEIVENAKKAFTSLDPQIIRRTAESIRRELFQRGAEHMEECFPLTVRTIYENLDANMGILSLSETLSARI